MSSRGCKERSQLLSFKGALSKESVDRHAWYFAENKEMAMEFSKIVKCLAMAYMPFVSGQLDVKVGLLVLQFKALWYQNAWGDTLMDCQIVVMDNGSCIFFAPYNAGECEGDIGRVSCLEPGSISLVLLDTGFIAAQPRSGNSLSVLPTFSVKLNE
ncbi:hypothetical protein BDN71DRAFT_1434363 [Pleurotus eryngii]|uniref:Uncharacterized protein n=1 Tax=Pleurotus eryngii TaxID=5323 RepID=A0A9P6DBM9_PLEER|nr:hypothetical protein BDN71DRAFT_1434363 [Pleurotus eryngii]